MDELASERLRDAAGRAFAGTPVLFACLFGSAATGRSLPDSDLDIAVYLEPRIGAGRYVDLSLDLAGRLSEAFRLGDVDILILNEAPLAVLGRAIQERVVIYSRDEPARVHFESRSLREFFDFEIHARPLDRKFLREFAEGRR